MSILINKPTFGVKPTITPNGTGNNTDAKRPEIGAIWEQTSRTDDKYMNIRLKLSKSKIQEILNSSTEEDVSINFIAFPNRNKTVGDNRPNFRVYEDRKKDGTNG